MGEGSDGTALALPRASVTSCARGLSNAHVFVHSSSLDLLKGPVFHVSRDLRTSPYSRIMYRLLHQRVRKGSVYSLARHCLAMGNLIQGPLDYPMSNLYLERCI